MKVYQQQHPAYLADYLHNLTQTKESPVQFVVI